MRTLILGWLGVAAIGWPNRKSSRAKMPNAAATLVLPVDGISDGFPIARSGFQYDHDGRLLLRAEYRDARGLPLTTTSRTRPIQELTARIFPHYRLVYRLSDPQDI